MKIVAIGGGEIGRPGFEIETELIDKEIIRLTGKKSPRVLFLPTASGDSRGYYEVIQDYFGKRLGCKTDVLYLLDRNLNRKGIEKKIFDSDIIYVGGGNTLRMIKEWRKQGVDEMLEEAGKKGIVLSGISAGAICWFKYGNSDSLKFKDKRNPLIKLRCLDFSPLMVCPHYGSEDERKPSLLKMIRSRGGRAIALENCSALEILEDKYRVITSNGSACAYLVYKQKGQVVEEKIVCDGKYRFIEELLKFK